jgi:hypothetical protein
LIEETLLIACSALAGTVSAAAISSRLFKKTHTKLHKNNDKPFEAAKSELQSLLFERSLVSEAISRVYGAAANEQIHKYERDRLLIKYNEQIAYYNEKIDELRPLVDFVEITELRDDITSLVERRVKAIDQRIDALYKKYDMSKFPPDMSENIVMHQNDLELEGKGQRLREVVKATRQGRDLHIMKRNEDKVNGSDEKEIEKLQKEVLAAISKLEQIEVPDGKTVDSEVTNVSMSLTDKSCLRQLR